tara:strand:+ start:4534 stop:7737 length:3204 start_codon:yes stop_codon:yes gene_type:complete
MINEKGNNGNIEFSGITQPSRTYLLEYTDIAKSTPSGAIESKHNNFYPGVGGVDIVNKVKEVELKDNEGQFSMEYYKTANGENYYHLPRRFDYPTTAGTIAAWEVRAAEERLDPPGGDGANPQTKNTGRIPNIKSPDPVFPTGTKRFTDAQKLRYLEYLAYQGYNINDNFSRPVTAPAAGYPSPNHSGWTAAVVNESLIVPEDAYKYGRSRCSPNAAALCPADWEYYGYGNNSADTKIWKQKNDNSRYTLFYKQRQYFSKDDQNSAVLGGGNYDSEGRGYDPTLDTGRFEKSSCNPYAKSDVVTASNGTIGRDPAVMNNWLRYKEIKKVVVSPGYNTPSECAEQITDSLNKTKDPEPIEKQLGTSYDQYSKIQMEGSSECYKPHPAAGHNFVKSTNFDTYEGGASTPAASVKADVDYEQASYCIGVKRPEFWEAGRNLYSDQLLYPGILTTAADGLGQNTDIVHWTIKATHEIVVNNTQPPTIVTTIPWDTPVGNAGNPNGNEPRFYQKQLKKFFDAQAKYEDLFDYPEQEKEGSVVPAYGLPNKVTPTNSRFLHIDVAGNDGTYPKQYLGSDNYESAGDAGTRFGSVVSRSSFPIFFDWNAEDGEDGESYPMENSHMTYGCMVKVTNSADGVATIGFRTTGLNGLPNCLFNNAKRQANVLDSYMTLGYDFHYSAYGTSVIQPYSGAMPADYDGGTAFMAPKNSVTKSDDEIHDYQFVSDFTNSAYCGANQIELGWDQQGGRFYWHQLHTPEYIGNLFKAGQTATTPLSADPTTQVYKINKRLQANNFCPDMMPYRPAVDTTESTQGSTTEKIPLSTYNPNFSDWSIFDAQSGVFISDFGLSKADWQYSIWAALGFSYNQLQAPSDTLSRQTKLNDLTNVSEIGAMTTNANISGGDIPIWKTNIYGAPLMTGDLPMTQLKVGNLNAVEEINMRWTLPAVTEPQMSVRISAEKLPTRMRNAYYLIKSDIVGDTKYIGTNGHGDASHLPIVGVVNKENGFGDYYFQSGTQMTFTITKPTVITSITTSIHDPDMRLARVDDNSAILYKVRKTNNGNYLIGTEMAQKGKLK